MIAAAQNRKNHRTIWLVANVLYFLVFAKVEFRRENVPTPSYRCVHRWCVLQKWTIGCKGGLRYLLGTRSSIVSRIITVLPRLMAKCCTTIDLVFVFPFFLFRGARNTSRPVDGPATNNRGEIQGARQAICDAGRSGVTDLRIHTDSDFLKKSVESYMPKWRQNDYTKTNGQRVVNERDFRALDREMSKYPNMNVEFEHVRAVMLATMAMNAPIVWPKKEPSNTKIMDTESLAMDWKCSRNMKLCKISIFLFVIGECLNGWHSKQINGQSMRYLFSSKTMCWFFHSSDIVKPTIIDLHSTYESNKICFPAGTFFFLVLWTSKRIEKGVGKRKKMRNRDKSLGINISV